MTCWDFAGLTDVDDLVKNSLGYFPLCGFGNFYDFIVGDDGDRVAIGVETYAFTRDVIDYDGVE